MDCVSLIPLGAKSAVTVSGTGFYTPPCPEADVKDELADGPVYVVDDDDWVCDSVTAMLEAFGFAVCSYSSGVDFLADERRARARCLIIDQHMPVLDGLAVIAELRRQHIVVPAILITGRLDPLITQRADELGVVATLEKPFPAARLRELVDRACGPRQ
jgi:FixJ family two-component response regulator